MDKKKQFQISFVLSRVLNSGVIMSIEKNEKEINGLEKTLAKITKRSYVSIFNSYTGAIHGALQGYGIGYNDFANLPNSSEKEERFLNWLGVANTIDKNAVIFDRISVNWNNINEFENDISNQSTLILDFTQLGFGPCAAIVTKEETVWKKAERLKIFGAFDLRTMWTQEESLPELQPGVQFNYRISPLVAACAKLSLIKRGVPVEN